jgi:hypothetical protein
MATTAVLTSTSADIYAGARVQLISDGDTAISIVQGTAIIAASSALTLALLAPRIGADDGKMLTILSAGDFEHVIHAAFNQLYSTLVFNGWTGNSVTLIAFEGGWLVFTYTGDTDAGTAILS